MEDEQEAELRNPFPSPPSHYTSYTTHNLKLLSLLNERTNGQNTSEQIQKDILSDQVDVPEWPLTSLEKPRVDWIQEEGYYNVFGDTWFLKETIPSLGEVGGHQLYPEDPAADRRPSLLSILKSMLVTYSSFLGALLAPSSATSTAPPEWHRQVEWITILAQNVMAAANDLRPVQARASLELMMKRQLELRKEETKAIHERCDSLEAQLSQLREMARQKSEEPSEQTGNKVPAPSTETDQFPLLPVDDITRWAEEV
ncbi:MED7 protein-domain-containing protein [Multifurca ochricompacta]|uniref:Mediator of RNA polymerase II transcription subunit 7 n=1 Tax=Multifurca ochricompacta TaxID=376703 RepID=A0AAD4QQS5_9AGAM|nr:MED7 protein-domain-containing protein [Multifurca ochricompacta]